MATCSCTTIWYELALWRHCYGKYYKVRNQQLEVSIRRTRFFSSVMIFLVDTLSNYRFLKTSYCELDYFPSKKSPCVDLHTDHANLLKGCVSESMDSIQMQLLSVHIDGTYMWLCSSLPKQNDIGVEPHDSTYLCIGVLL